MSNFTSCGSFSPSSFASSTLILPAVSLGNVPQLTADLLIFSLGLKRVGFVGKGDTVAPFAGRGEKGGEIVTGGVEVYGQEGSELYVIQQRSPTLKSQKDRHITLLKTFINSNAFGAVLILTSLDSAIQNDAQLLTPYQRIIPPSLSSLPSQLQKIQNIPPLSLSLSQPATSVQNITSSYPPFLPAAGLTRRLLTALLEEKTSMPHGAIAAWCVEGDNRGDSRSFADMVLYVLDLQDVVQVQEPASWEGLFGTTEGWSGGSGADAELYG
ncbi:proteasome assembly chaperone 2 [Cryptococcus bacillisporus CA1873]|uniref:Proteasome assembly chaperone 2 n=1 Tax=Cryptococcus bacillisporus CA1873 TaxID=1296111 RepID=A0ABR5BBF2_CRYGA|nr:proteasome assembly chaperone 2 [Cryptococcus bacillisporus CA1873]|eukprot:KIR63636.1 proteasome assembly chaperone 2 [Cryptococcus gattii CA1873]